jgi:enoyl-CoA hydratase
MTPTVRCTTGCRAAEHWGPPVSDHFRRTDSDGIITITFTRDDKLNAVSPEMLDGLRSAVDDLGDDPANRVLVITGEGRHFTAGIDIGGMPRTRDDSGIVVRRNYRKLHLLFDEMEAIEKPIVLAANGPCRGVGMEMASSVDFRLCSDRSVFGLPEIPNLAVIPGSGGISRLTRLVGPHWARYIALAGKMVDADTARMMGFIHEIYPDAEFAERTQAFARDLAALPMEAIGLAKIAIDAAASSDRKTARDVDRMANSLLFKTQDAIDSVTRFQERGKKKS